MLRTHTEDICRPGRSPGHPPPCAQTRWGGVLGAKGMSCKCQVGFICPGEQGVLGIRPGHMSCTYVLGANHSHCAPGHIPRTGGVSWGTCPLLFVFPRTGGGWSPGQGGVLGLRPGHIRVYRCTIQHSMCKFESHLMSFMSKMTTIEHT